MRLIHILHIFTLLCFFQVSASAQLTDKQLQNIRLQIYLDQQHFGPGVLDGKLGTYTKMAVEAYNQKLSSKLNDWDGVRAHAIKQVINSFAMAIVPDAAPTFVNPELPSAKDRELQAKQSQMSYRSIAEFMAERYHTTEDVLIALNGYKKIKNLKIRDPIQVPNVMPFLIENLDDGKSYKKDKNLSRRWVVIDTKKKQLRIFEAAFDLIEKKPNDAPAKAVIVDEDFVPYDESKAELIAAFPITAGKSQFIHYGEWQIRNAVEFPTWRYDKQLLETGVRSKTGLIIPSGPNNPVGVLWLGLSKSGIGIHGTDSPRTIGRARSSGCIRMANCSEHFFER